MSNGSAIEIVSELSPWAKKSFSTDDLKPIYGLEF